MNEMHELLCGSSMREGVLHVVNRTAQSVEKLEKTLSDFISSTGAAITGTNTRLDRIGEIVSRHDLQLAGGAQARSSLFNRFIGSVIDGTVRGAVQAVILLFGIAAFLYRVHLPAISGH